MSSAQDSKEHIEQAALLKLLARIEREPSVSQRVLASELGIALGLMNNYLKRCVKKGWIRVSQVPARRFVYYLTPEGFKEKSRMVASHLTNSLTFFRSAHAQCTEALNICLDNEWRKIALVGPGDLADIVRLVAQSIPIHVELVGELHLLKDFDAVIVTDITMPQETFNKTKEYVKEQRLLTLEVLHITRAPNILQHAA
jgi:DNA-binding MarR family transcriptional regulator